MNALNAHARLAMTVTGFLMLSASALAFEGGLATIQRTVTLKPQAEVWSQSVCLDDVVQESWVKSRCAVDRKACCAWNLKGATRKTFTSQELVRGLSSIRFAGVELVLAGDQIEVTQTHRELAAGEIRDRVREAAVAKFGAGPDALSVTSVKISNPAFVELAAESDWDVLLSDELQENSVARIVSTKNLTTLGTAQVSLRLDTEIFVARKMIHPNEALELADFELKRINVIGYRGGLNESAQANIVRKDAFPPGVRARQTIAMGAPLLLSAIERVPLVRLGDTVTLLLKSDSLRISTKGVVQGSASVGDMVTVQLPRYNRTFRGRLIEGRLVEVWL